MHGDDSWSVDRQHNLPGSPMLAPNFNRAFAERHLMDQLPYRLDRPRRQEVLAIIGAANVPRPLSGMPSVHLML